MILKINTSETIYVLEDNARATEQLWNTIQKYHACRNLKLTVMDEINKKFAFRRA